MISPIALVTGGGSGIGRAVAELLARDGVSVLVTDIDEESAEEVAKGITSEGGVAWAERMDVADPVSVTRVIEGTAATRGPAEMIANVAGVLHIAPALGTTLEAFDRIVGVNLRGTFLVNVAAASALRSVGRSGSIVNVSSIHAVLSEKNASAYTATKGGVEAMSRTFASEWAEYGVRVNCVRPGATRTALTERLYTPDVLRGLAQRIPMVRPATPEEIAQGIAFLLSPKASYITGTTLDIDGGYIMDGSLPNTSYQSNLRDEKARARRG